MHIDSSDGLADNYVLDVAIDNQGFTWVATEEGLTQIAGNIRRTYNTSNSGLTSNKIVGLYYDKYHDALWCRTFNCGICIFDCISRSFTTLDIESGLLSNFINGLSESRDRGVWIVTADAGIQHFDPETKQFVNYTADNCTDLYKDTRCCYEDGYGHLLIGYSNNGMGVLNLDRRTVKNYSHSSENSRSIPGDLVRTICVDSYNNIWVGTNQGLGLMDAETGSFYTFMHSEDDSSSLVGDNIFSIKEMSDHSLWVCANLGGISIIDLTSFIPGQVVRMKNLTDKNSPLSSINVRAVAEDGFQNKWVGNYLSGVDVIAEGNTSFRILPNYYMTSQGERKVKHTYAITSDRDESVWVGGENEIALFRDGIWIDSWDFSPHIKQTITTPQAMYVDESGDLWLGLNDEGILLFNVEKETFTRISPEGERFDVHAIVEDKNGDIWIGTEIGIMRYANSVLEKMETKGKYANICPYGLAIDADGRIWCGSLGDGLVIFSKEGNALKEFNTENGFCSNDLSQIYVDKDGAFWLATYEGLVYVPDPRHEDVMTFYNKGNNLNSVNVRGIVEDRMGSIWVSTMDGISHFDRRTHLFHNHSYMGNVRMGDFVEGSAASAKGHLYFGSPSGVCFFNPQDQRAIHLDSSVQIVSVEVLDRNENVWKETSLPIDNKEDIRLKYRNNTIRINYSVDDCSQAFRTTYFYRISGMVDEWVNNGNTNQITIFSMQHGKHTLSIRGSIDGSETSYTAVRELPLVIAPPLWMSLPALLAYALLAIIVSTFIVRYFNLNINLKLEKQQRQNELSLNEERLRFFTNITHELRTPLTLIMGPLEDLVNEQNLSEPYSSRISNIYKSTQRLYSLINQILEFRKTQTQNKELNVKCDHLSVLVEEIGDRYQALNRNPEVEIIVETSDCGKLYYDHDIVTTVLDNLMSNAIKYTARGHIKLSLIEETIRGEQYCTMSVEDTGYGIGEGELDKIFDRYYQVKGKHQAAGTGIGLALVKALSEIHQGLIGVTSKQGEGSIFSFSIKKNNTYPQAKHIGNMVEQTSFSENINESELQEGTPERIMLIVEDDPDILQYISGILANDYRIYTANNGKEGLALALNIIPDMIVSDVMMPVMDGVEMCASLKSDVRTSHIPVILLTAKDSVQDKIAGYESGADSYLTKPFSSQLILSRINNIFEARRKVSLRLIGDAEQKAVGDSPLEQLNQYDREFLDKFEMLVQDNLDNSDFDISLVADYFNMSYSTLYRKIKGLTGAPAKEYIRSIKMRKAMEYLKTGKYNVADVAYMIGYNNVGHFRNTFKDQFGINPSSVGKHDI